MTATAISDASIDFYLRDLWRLVETVERRMPLDPNYKPNFVLPHDQPPRPKGLEPETPAAEYCSGLLAGVPIAFNLGGTAIGAAVLAIALVQPVQPVRSTPMTYPSYYVAGDALARLQADMDALPIRTFKVSYRIEGTLTIRATSAESASELAEAKTLLHLAQQGELEMDDPVEVVTR